MYLTSETLSLVFQFEICDTYIWTHVRHNSSAGTYYNLELLTTF